MNFETFTSDVLATILGGVILAILFFWVKEKLFHLPKLIGRWHFEMLTQTTSYNPYQNMVLRYVAILWCEGNKVYGTAEKIYENSSTGERIFVGKDRTRGTVCGFIEKRYFGKDHVFIHIVENGHGRESTNFYELVFDKEKMSGSFVSMVANQTGKTEWQRNSF